MSRESQQSADATTAYIALGSNLGDRERTLRSAITALRQLGSVDAVSSFYETAPVGIVEQPDFLNAVVALRTLLPPQELMAALLRIEQQHGRDRSASLAKGPRTLDLDLLSYGDSVMETPTLTLPHPSLRRAEICSGTIDGNRAALASSCQRENCRGIAVGAVAPRRRFQSAPP